MESHVWFGDAQTPRAGSSHHERILDQSANRLRIRAGCALALLLSAWLLAAAPAMAQQSAAPLDYKIGFVSTERVMR